ncbi:Uncharacterised protein [Acinetobacter baumannii]|nr:Uncharacterised protein [Acinetobacter baumannii]
MPGVVRPHPGAGDRLGGGKHPGMDARQGPGLGHRRVRHAAPSHPHAGTARGGGRKAVGPHAGNPAADRPFPARGGGPEGAG